MSGEQRPTNSTFLEVDPSIIEDGVMFTRDNHDDDINNFLLPGIPTSQLIKPSPGFCLKTRMKHEDKKIFINVCKTDCIPPPEDKSDEELLSILHSDEPSSFRVPMSIGEGRMECDNSGQPSTVYDIAINTSFFMKIQKSPTFHAFFINVIFEGIQDKYQFELEMNKYVILKNKKSFGTLQVHRIQSTDIERSKRGGKPLIEEIKTKVSVLPRRQTSKQQTINAAQRDKITEMEYRLLREPREGRIEYLVAEFKIDRNLSPRDVALDVGEDRIIVETRKANKLVDVFVPYYIKQETAKAVLNRNTSILTVTMAAADAPAA